MFRYCFNYTCRSFIHSNLLYLDHGTGNRYKCPGVDDLGLFGWIKHTYGEFLSTLYQAFGNYSSTSFQ
ncbi:hypothetical protein DPMN_057706 [Dreissena polymorpha]|uniref:Uncharacterized protein n=1 Tax=Dreissena polymorpha TaxID=45954 RepID=A0A9D4C0R7_DREPO|nr:hypothetical protein DPMN_057706 [Dreissena polymorpha]